MFSWATKLNVKHSCCLQQLILCEAMECLHQWIFDRCCEKTLWAWPIAKWFSSIQGIWEYKVFECATYSLGVIGKDMFSEVIAPLQADICSFFFVWDIHRSLDQPSKLHHPPLHGLACSTTFSWRKMKIKILMITIGFLAPLVLGNAYVCMLACLHTAPRAWPPNNKVTESVFARRLLIEMQSLTPSKAWRYTPKSRLKPTVSYFTKKSSTKDEFPLSYNQVS